jgi:hypothetical protein
MPYAAVVALLTLGLLLVLLLELRIAYLLREIFQSLRGYPSRLL